jgi:hypothetical protein
LREGCKECPVYRVRAAFCFEMLGMGADADHLKVFCQNSCEDCAYYRRVKGLKIVVPGNPDLVDTLRVEPPPFLHTSFYVDGRCDRGAGFLSHACRPSN